MPLKRHEGQRWTEPLAGRLPADASVADVADTIAELWKGVDRVLQPIIGPRGVAALYHRSLTITAADYPWLPVNPGGVLAAVDAAALRAALTSREVVEAAAAGAALFQTFRDLLASLIGASLTDRLLHSTWSPASGTPRPQDTAP